MKKFLVPAALLISGCATLSGNNVGPTLGQYQQSCERTFLKLSQIAECLDTSVGNDARFADDPEVKLYVLNAKALGQKVDKNEVEDTDARVQLQRAYVELKQRRDAETNTQQQTRREALAQAFKNVQDNGYKVVQPTYTAPPVQTNPIKTTNCTAYGNSVNCQSF